MSSQQSSIPSGSGKGIPRGKGGKGKFAGKAKRHRNQVDAINGITKPAIRRLCRRGGIKRIGGLMYEESRAILKAWLENVLHDSLTYAEHARRKTMTAADIVFALNRQGQTLYGFDPGSTKGWGKSKHVKNKAPS